MCVYIYSIHILFIYLYCIQYIVYANIFCTYICIHNSIQYQKIFKSEQCNMLIRWEKYDPKILSNVVIPPFIYISYWCFHNFKVYYILYNLFCYSTYFPSNPLMNSLKLCFNSLIFLLYILWIVIFLYWTLKSYELTFWYNVCTYKLLHSNNFLL